MGRRGNAKAPAPRLPGTKTRRAVAYPTKIIDQCCSKCGGPLTEIHWNHYYFIHWCNNMSCRLSHRPQGGRAKTKEELNECESPN